MKLYYTDRFKKQYKKLPKRVKEAVEKQLGLLMSNPEHPSLNIKIMQNQGNIWEGRITKSYRFTFHVLKDVYILRNVGKHDILKKP